MCGICGIVNLTGIPADSSLLEEMISAQKHRGPDDNGIQMFGNAGLGHCRLSIIDLTSGKQPLCNETGDVWISFNGEIYNYKHLRNGLSSLGHTFRTNSDTETIVHLYEQYGTGCLDKLEGMFALAIHDSVKNTLLLARDRLGKKPLYYHLSNSSIVFASELQALVRHKAITREINPQSVHDYLEFNYIPHPDTIYKNVFKLPPGCYLSLDIKNRIPEIRRYWNCSYSPKIRISYNDAKVQLRNLLEDAVKKRLMSEVPLGTFLSGGTDSTIVTGLMAKLSGEQVKTFTIGFRENNYDERNYARIASDKFNTHHFEKVVAPDDFSIVENLVSNFGEPYADSSLLPTYLLSRFARENITVALTGDGGDEIFAGYYRYLLFRYANLAESIPFPLRKAFFSTLDKVIPGSRDERGLGARLKRISRMLAEKKEDRYLNIISRCDNSLKHFLYGSRMTDESLRPTGNLITEYFRHASSDNPVEALMEVDLNSYLPCDLLAKSDTTSMANSLELRCPLLDHKIVEFAASLPLEYKQNISGGRKIILIDSCSDIIPAQLLKRRKMGFGVPVAHWLRKEWKNKAAEILLNSEFARDGFFKQKSIENIFRLHIENKADFSYVLFALIMLELWYRKFHA